MAGAQSAPTGKRMMAGLLVAAAIVACIWAATAALNALRDAAHNQALEAERAELAARREEFVRAAKLVGTPLVQQPALERSDFRSARARFQPIYEGRHTTFKDAELSKAWATITGDAEHGTLLLDRIAQVDQNKPSVLEIGVGAMQQDRDGNSMAVSPAARRIAAETDKVLLTRELRQAMSDLDRSSAGLRQFADRSYPASTGGNVRLQYLPSWSGTYAADTLQLTNTSTQDLRDAVIFVSVYDRSNNARTYVHYVDLWPAGGNVGTNYPVRDTDFANAKAGGTPDHVDTTIYVPGGIINARYALTQEELDTIVKRYCGRLQFTGMQLGPYDEAVTGKKFSAGYQFSFTGLDSLPVTAVEVRYVLQDGSVRRSAWTYDPGSRLSAAETYSFRSPSLDGDAPDHIELVFSFAETNFQEVFEGH